MNTLSQALARRCTADWARAFDPAQRDALSACVATAFVDTAACILAGREEAPTRVVAQWVRRRGAAGPSSLLFSTEHADPASAALVNGVAGHALVFDDVGLAGHPSVVIVPALLAEQERSATTGFPVVQAYAKAYAVWGELVRRTPVSLHARGWHPSAVFGVVAAAAGVGALRGLDEHRLAHALGMAASMSGGIVANFGSMTKPLHLGRAAEAGIHAVDLAEAGLDASADALDGPAGLLSALAGGAAHVDLSPGLPDEFETTLLRRRPGIKKYPVCYAAHRCIDGVLDLAARHRIAPADIAAVQATISETTAAVLRHHDPATLAEARFSMEFALAASLVHGQLGITQVSRAALDDPAVRALMRRVGTDTVSTSCPLEPSFALTDRVRIVLNDGTALDSGPIRFARGHAELPLDDAQLREKLYACVGPHESALAQRVLDQVRGVLA